MVHMLFGSATSPYAVSSSSEAHAFHRFQLASNSALAWSSVAARLSCVGSLACWERSVERPEPAQIGGAGAGLIDAADAPLAAEDQNASGESGQSSGGRGGGLSANIVHVSDMVRQSLRMS